MNGIHRSPSLRVLPSLVSLTPTPLQANRDRLLATLALTQQLSPAQLWQSLTATQQGVFLTLTDLLGKRSVLSNAGQGGRAGNGAPAESALDHVTRIYAIRDADCEKDCGNGGVDNNRMFFSVDDLLMKSLRSFGSGLPEWGPSNDKAGPHAPFTASAETLHGQPRGQAHFWEQDSDALPTGRPGVEQVDDPRLVEMDIDYNWAHDSNPQGFYSGVQGRVLYASLWTPLGRGGSPEFDYAPAS